MQCLGLALRDSGPGARRPSGERKYADGLRGVLEVRRVRQGLLGGRHVREGREPLPHLPPRRPPAGRQRGGGRGGEGAELLRERGLQRQVPRHGAAGPQRPAHPGADGPRRRRERRGHPAAGADLPRRCVAGCAVRQRGHAGCPGGLRVARARALRRGGGEGRAADGGRGHGPARGVGGVAGAQLRRSAPLNFVGAAPAPAPGALTPVSSRASLPARCVA
mmetsp:Transcript_102736/g.286110  ORF Transcript_102736/g.286110 Transcript_102736/m.286110 type:complete len:220 (+) Transcript_102736:308-967(+)